MTHSRAVERLRSEDSQRRRVEAARREPVDATAPDPGRALAVHEAGSKHLPGSRRYARREKANAEGISIDAKSLEMLERLTRP